MLLALAVTSPPTIAWAHSVSPGAVVSRINGDDMKQAVGVVSAAADAKLERLLVIRVGAGWHSADPELRRRVAEKWRHLWRDATTNGIVAVIDDQTEQSLVGYSITGAVTLHALTEHAPTDE